MRPAAYDDTGLHVEDAESVEHSLVRLGRMDHSGKNASDMIWSKDQGQVAGNVLRESRVWRSASIAANR
jgi:hypothetical protein